MRKANVFDFDDELEKSKEITDSPFFRQILLDNIPGARSIISSKIADDKKGIDLWVELENGDRLSVDAKIRGEDWAEKPEPLTSDDLALETWSDIENGKIGWTRDTKKRTDYVIWYWKDTERWHMVPFPMLCAVFVKNWEKWKATYRTRPQETKGTRLEGECTFVPRLIVWREIYKMYNRKVSDKN